MTANATVTASATVPGSPVGRGRTPDDRSRARSWESDLRATWRRLHRLDARLSTPDPSPAARLGTLRLFEAASAMAARLEWTAGTDLVRFRRAQALSARQRQLRAGLDEFLGGIDVDDWLAQVASEPGLDRYDAVARRARAGRGPRTSRVDPGPPSSAP